MDDLEDGRGIMPTVKVASSRGHQLQNDVIDYEDGVMHIDCRPFWRFFGFHNFPSGMRYLWFVKDICGIICAVFTWLLILYAAFVVLFVMLLPNPNQTHSIINAIIFQWFTFLAVASHLRTMFSDPGAVPMGNATEENIGKLGLKEGQVIYKCPKCVSIKPERAHHCSICRRCIKKMDHHCPWVNNCVGENNQKFFILFTMYIFIISCHALYLIVSQYVICVGQDWKACTGYSLAATTVFLLFLLCEALLFGIFTAIMCFAQLCAVCFDETGIEQLKREQATWVKRSKWMSLKSVFGHPFSLKWFSPFHSPVYGKQEYYMYNV